MSGRYSISVRILPNGAPFTIVGRDAWALERLIDAGDVGCTPISQPAPRWSHYIWKIRTKYGIAVETIDEAHGGRFAGTHARYIIRSEVAILRDNAERRVA